MIDDLQMITIHDQTLSQKDFATVQRLIYELAGITLSDAKLIMAQGRLAKRLRALGIDNFSNYLRYLQAPGNSEEIIKFTNALTTNKTDFFRESHHFEFLQKVAFPELRAAGERSGQKRLRIWCAAASTGEEPYTLAMSVREFFGPSTDWDIRILASDIDTDVLQKASEGVYTEDRLIDVPESLIRKYFSRVRGQGEQSYQVVPALRDLITFRRINLQDREWPINVPFDVIFCRNVMIYFDAQSQRQIVEHFSDYLKQDAYLMIGHSESLFGLSDVFSPLGDTVYRHTASESKKRSLGPVAAPKKVEQMVAKPRSSNANTAVANNKQLVADTTSSDPRQGIIVGEVFVSAEPYWITTLLGSCVGVCLYDEQARIGGMNHFMLPSSSHCSVPSASYGVHSMELLINEIMKNGGRRERLKAKVFGGACVSKHVKRSASIGTDNVAFAKEFLHVEKIPIVASHTGGTEGMQVRFHTQTAKVLVRMLDPIESFDVEVLTEQKAEQIQHSIERPAEVTLF